MRQLFCQFYNSFLQSNPPIYISILIFYRIYVLHSTFNLYISIYIIGQ
nr:MAG TPA: hypothetical protein [Caudoviricetes sp.]DAU54112.1 MAG TPA: hypothetical protein [Caudoviricetes sp.]DAX27173.1 MAG TPA: hypothetical protein [Caudoviricetes sp.]DAY46454.1 MAG TPA: hypothetical protein [Caudoviricetes sp.]